MRLIRIRAKYTDVSAATLTAYHDGLVDTFGFTAVGTPIRRTFGGGVVAAALYEDGLVVLRANASLLIVMHLARNVDLVALEAFTESTFGLTDMVVIRDSE